MLKKVIFLIFVLALFFGTRYVMLKNKQYEALTPTECWINMYDLTKNQIEELNADIDFEKNIQKKDYRFICILGMSHIFPSLTYEKDIDIIMENGSKLICVGDIKYYPDDTEKGMKLYRYAEKYNKLLLNKIRK